MAYWQEKKFLPDKDRKTVLVHDPTSSIWELPIWQAAMPPPPLKDDRTHFCSSLCSFRSARSPRYEWSHGNDCSSTGLGRDRNITSHSISSHQHSHLLFLGSHWHHKKWCQAPWHVWGAPWAQLICQCRHSSCKVTQEKAFLLVQEGTTAASEVPGNLLVLVMWDKTCPLVQLVSYFFVVRTPILLPSSSFPQQCFRLRPKHAESELQGTNHDLICLK